MKKLYILLIMIIGIGSLNAQQRLLNQVDHRIVYEKQDSVTKQARVKSYDIKPRKRRLYYWYWKNSFQQNYGGFEGVLLDGDYIVFDKQENLLEKAIFKKGIIRGFYKYWNTDGTLIKEERWRCGKKTGVYKIYNDKGELIEKGWNCNGKKNGTSSFYVDGKEYKKLKYKEDKMMKDLSAEKREKEDESIQKKRDRIANKKLKEEEKAKKKTSEKVKETK